MDALSITGDEIMSWAARVDAPAVLPDLIRRLIWATNAPHEIEFRADGGVYYGGWDGRVKAAAGSAFCPAGVSCWELSTDRNVGQKLDRDYGKRTGDAAATYVALTAHRFSAKAEWADVRRAEGKWRDARALDADDLSMWLAAAPAVAVWFASLHLRRPLDDLTTLDEFLDEWSHLTEPPLPRALLLLGKERAQLVDQIHTWATGQPSRITIAAHTRGEGLQFVAAALASLPEEIGVAARALVVRSERALRWADRQSESLVLVPTINPTGLVATSRHHLVVALDERGAKERADLQLGRVPYRLLEAELDSAGFEDAARLARESQGSLVSLARLCGAPEVPAWASEPSRPLLALLLAGEWRLSNEADVAVLSRLSGSSREDLETLCSRLGNMPDAPLLEHHEAHRPPSWRWTSPGDAWTWLSGGLTRSLLSDFRQAALEVLGEEDRVFSMDKPERFYAPLHGKALKHSEVLRQGMAKAHARLALSGEAGAVDGDAFAIGFVRDLLRSDWIAWASLSDVLPVIAEAAPNAFLDALMQSLDAGSAGVAHVFAEEGEYSNPHTGLLWALERLAWAPLRFPRVALVLARLAEVDPGGRLGNRPAASFHRLLHPVMPATNAGVEERIATLRQVLGRIPATGWRLARALLGSHGLGLVLPAEKPEFFDERCEDRRVSLAESLRFGEAVTDLVLEHVGEDASRWLELVELRQVPDGSRTQILAALGSLVAGGRLSDPDRRLWDGIRDELHMELLHEETRNSPEAQGLRELYIALTPSDPVDAALWLFAPGKRLPEFVPDGWKAETARMVELATEAVAHLSEEGGNLAPLQVLAQRVEAPVALGIRLANAPFADAVEHAMTLPNDTSWTRVRPGFLAARSLTLGLDWLRERLESLQAEPQRDEVVRTLHLLPSVVATWDLADALGAEVRSAFWRTDTFVYPQDQADAPRVVASLLEEAQYARAFDVAGHTAEHLSPSIVLRVLRGFAENPSEQTRVPTGVGYSAERLFSRLYASGDVDEVEVAGLELVYLSVLAEPHGVPADLRLFRALGHQPKFFAELVRWLYRKDPDVPTEPEEPATNDVRRRREAAASNAFRLLRAWNGHPGSEQTGEARERDIQEWTASVLELTKQDGRTGPGEAAVAQVLARIPAGADGVWPCEAARRLIEDGRGRFRAELRIAKRNMRGVVSRALFEGGRQEKELAAGCRDDARRLREAGGWSETAALLDEMAVDFEREARREDVAAHDERLASGYDE
jgi:hypothetical protein